MATRYSNYLNLDSTNNYAYFEYCFQIDKDVIEYQYKKTNLNNLLFEKIIWNGETILEYDFIEPTKIMINIPEANNLNWNNNDSSISAVKYIINNTFLPSSHPLVKMIKFVNGMLWFRNIENNSFIGIKNDITYLDDIIIKNDKLLDFQEFLKKYGIDYKLTKVSGEMDKIGVEFKNGKGLFGSIASTGTKSLWLLYCWIINFGEVSLLFIDEFDSNYHYDLSRKIVKLLNENMLQVILTTHNTALMNNELTRPDSTFVICDGKINSLSNCTDKELREAHNIEKLYREGHFTD